MERKIVKQFAKKSSGLVCSMIFVLFASAELIATIIHALLARILLLVFEGKHLMKLVLFNIFTLLVLFASSASGQVLTITDSVFDSNTGAFSVTGTQGADSIVITVTKDNIVEVGDVESGVNAGDVRTIFVDGLAGDDSIDLSGVLQSRFTSISTTEGAITMEGGAGNDTICGSPGNDSIFGGSGGGVSIVGDVDLNGVVDSLDISPFINSLASGVFQFEADINRDGEVNFGDVRPFLQLQLALDLLVDGDDILIGGAGSDVISGGAGDDTLFGGSEGGDSIVGDVDLNGVVDSLDISPFIDLLGSGVFQFEADINGDGEVNFGDVSPFLQLLLAVDVLVDGDDILKGGAGADVISGGAGDDTLFGFRPAAGDVNRDGEVDFFDVSPFVSVFGAGSFQLEADINGDGEVNSEDASLFVDLLFDAQLVSLMNDGAADELNGGTGNDTLVDDGSPE